jgi:hypothetical protein
MILPMPLLRMREATFAGASARAGPVTLDLERGGRAALHCASAQESAIIALLACGVAKASTGYVLIDDYDPRVQSVACKRIAALVPHEPFALTEGEFTRYVEYRAALWKIEAHRARAHADLLRKRLTGMHEAFAYPLIGALIGSPKLIVLDRPQPVYAPQIIAVLGDCAMFSTHGDAASAYAFGPRAIDLLRQARA